MNMKHQITIPELKVLEQQSAVFIIDVREPEEFQESHIPNALNVPISSLEQNLSQFSDDVLIVTACGRGGGRARRAQEFLMNAGKNAKWLEGGSLGYLDTLGH